VTQMTSVSQVPTHGRVYAKSIKTIEKDIADIPERVVEVCGIGLRHGPRSTPADGILYPTNRWSMRAASSGARPENAASPNSAALRSI
jgi:hypothetical protein